MGIAVGREGNGFAHDGSAEVVDVAGLDHHRATARNGAAVVVEVLPVPGNHHDAAAQGSRGFSVADLGHQHGLH
ncbi:hypothetical protein D3C86_2098940 [compost metagenome]